MCITCQKAGGTSVIRTLFRGALIAASVAIASGVSCGAASADGKVTWQSNSSGRYLEVYSSSTAEGALVDTWPWNGTNTQYWEDVQLSTGYWWEINENSGLLLTAYNTCSDGITQWGSGSGSDGYTTQQWKEYHYSTHVWEIVNHAGCNGNPYWDTMGQSQSGSSYPVFLYPESDTNAPATCYTYSKTPLVACTWN